MALTYTYASPYCAEACINRISCYPCEFDNDSLFFHRIFHYECTIHSNTLMTIVFSGIEYGFFSGCVHYLLTFVQHDKGCQIVAEFRGKGLPLINTAHLDLLMKKKVDGVRIT